MTTRSLAIGMPILAGFEIAPAPAKPWDATKHSDGKTVGKWTEE